jgi:hypothetical protein
MISIRSRRHHIFWPLAWTGMLLWLSSIPGMPLPGDPAAYGLFQWMPPSLQNLLHPPAYGGLAWLWRWSLQAWLIRGGAPAAFALTAGTGLLDEWHQSFVPGRYGSATDAALDWVGAAAALWLFWRVGSGESRTSNINQ